MFSLWSSFNHRPRGEGVITFISGYNISENKYSIQYLESLNFVALKKINLFYSGFCHYQNILVIHLDYFWNSTPMDVISGSVFHIITCDVSTIHMYKRSRINKLWIFAISNCIYNYQNSLFLLSISDWVFNIITIHMSIIDTGKSDCYGERKRTGRFHV